MQEIDSAPQKSARFQVKSNRLYVLIPYLISFCWAFPSQAISLRSRICPSNLAWALRAWASSPRPGRLAWWYCRWLSLRWRISSQKLFAQIFGWIYVAFSLLMGIFGSNFYVVLISVFFYLRLLDDAVCIAYRHPGRDCPQKDQPIFQCAEPCEQRRQHGLSHYFRVPHEPGHELARALRYSLCSSG